MKIKNKNNYNFSTFILYLIYEIYCSFYYSN